MDRILIISANALSDRLNNGLTIKSIINCMNPKEVYQVFIHNEIPDPFQKGHFYKITDRDVLKSFMRGGKSGFELDLNTSKDNNLNSNQTVSNLVRVNERSRIIREFVWKSHNWRSLEFETWLGMVNPELVFFVAGDFIGLYDIYNYIGELMPKSKRILYVTDDYLLKRSSFLYNIRRYFVEKHFKDAISSCDLLFTISEKMRKTYQEKYGINSVVISNISENLEYDSSTTDGDELVLIYAGGLHYGRDHVLLEIAKAMQLYQCAKSKLMIYTKIKNLDEEVKTNFEQIDCVSLHDVVSRQELLEKYKEADILVFVESFDKKNIECTRLSFSTKISEYLSMKKMIFAVGPSEASSIEYLSDCSVVCNSISSIKTCMDDLFKAELREKYAAKAHEKYEMNHNKEMLEKKIISALSMLDSNDKDNKSQ